MLLAISEWVSHFLPLYFITRDSGICEVPQKQIAEYLNAKTDLWLAELERKDDS